MVHISIIHTYHSLSVVPLLFQVFLTNPKPPLEPFPSPLLWSDILECQMSDKIELVFLQEKDA